MRNVPIQGGRVVGPPRTWDEEQLGPCLDLHVLTVAPPYPEMATTYSAWQFAEEEASALENGGHFLIGVTLPYVPVLRLIVQDRDGNPVGELRASSVGVQPVAPPTARADLDRMREVAAALRAAIIAIGRRVEELLRGASDAEHWLREDNAGIVSRLNDLVERLGRASPSGLRRVPLLTLDDIVRGDMGAGKPFPGEPVDPAAQADLERALGVQLNPPPPPPAEEPHRYTVGKRTMARVFQPNGITDLSDLQVVLDAVEAALSREGE